MTILSAFPLGAATNIPHTRPNGRVCGRAIAFRDGWSESRSGGRVHHAIDIHAPLGTPVVSATAGRVVRVHDRDEGRTGFGVTIRDPEGRMHHYAHFRAVPLVHERERVEPGTMLGQVGTTGNAADSCPHLHYQIETRAGDRINPFPEVLRLAREEGVQAIVATADGQRVRLEPATPRVPRTPAEEPQRHPLTPSAGRARRAAGSGGLALGVALVLGYALTKRQGRK